MALDYEKLFKAYVAWVLVMEGITYLEALYDTTRLGCGDQFNDEERAFFKRLDEDAG